RDLLEELVHTEGAHVLLGLVQVVRDLPVVGEGRLHGPSQRLVLHPSVPPTVPLVHELEGGGARDLLDLPVHCLALEAVRGLLALFYHPFK
ncbi:dna-directed rna polymerase iii largest, partial [Nannochloropsis gaditana CCMP526]|uniref:dna-directed rna polymerase iii largest n=1 Tax=Nannochloropsis gaditana (strain CCMP526) TaxID=1093141 RepID=UPI00029F6AF4